MGVCDPAGSVVYVVAGGALGAAARYLSIQLVGQGDGKFAMGTLLVNCVGSLLAGFLAGFFTPDDTKWRLLLLTGFLGAYTTFSTYALETAIKMLDGDAVYVVVNMVLNNVLSVGAVMLGLFVCGAVLPK